MAGLADITLIQAADMVASGKTTSLDLLHACWANLDAVNPQVNAVIWQEREQAETAARAADEAVRNKQRLSPLHGVPMAHKDMYYQAGKLSTCGSALRKDFRPTVTATVIERLSVAGAYTWGGLNMAEFAQKIRYVSISTNLSRGGGYVPHTADAVLKAAYGDCKDKSNLLRAMLKSAGVDSYMVSIYSGNPRFTQEEFPSPSQFNHAILAIRVPDAVTLPAAFTHPEVGRLLLFDPTDAHVAFGFIPSHEQNSRALLMAGRIVASLTHGAFFGLGATVASELVPAHRRSSAIALMFSGLTLANVLGVPIGAWIGEHAGWRATFWAVSGLGLIALGALLLLVPRHLRLQSRPGQGSGWHLLRKPRLLGALGNALRHFGRQSWRQALPGRGHDVDEQLLAGLDVVHRKRRPETKANALVVGIDTGHGHIIR